MKRFLHNFSFFLVAPILSSCMGGEEATIPNDADYLPLQTGAYQIYHVTGIRYSEVFPIDTFEYQLMTEVMDSFPNAENGFTYVVYRSISYDSGETWTYEDTWSIRLNDQQAVVTEGTASYVKFKIPVIAEDVWDGNLFNTGEPDEYEMADPRKPFDVGDQHFDDCITVIQNNTDDFVKTDQRQEMYARGVGLIFAEKNILNYCTEADCFGQKEIKDGTLYKQSILTYGSW